MVYALFHTVGLNVFPCIPSLIKRYFQVIGDVFVVSEIALGVWCK